MSSFRVKKPEFKCRTLFCGKKLSFEENSTKINCDKCKKRYTIKKRGEDFNISYNRYPIYPFGVLAEKYKELIKKYRFLYEIHRLLSKVFRYLILPGFLLVIFIYSVFIFGYFINIYIPQLFVIWLTKTPIDLNTGTNIVLFGIIAAFVLGFIYFFSYGWSILTGLIKKPELDNKYLSFGLALSILIILLGGNLFNLFLGSYFPISITPKPNDLANITVECRSDGNMMLDPVYGNNFLCAISVENTDNTNLISLYFFDYYFPTANQTLLNSPGDIEWYPISKDYKIGGISLRIGKEGRHKLRVEADYTNKSQRFQSVGEKEYTSLTRAEYEDKQYKRLAFLIGLFSIAIISVFSVMNNIKSILD